MKESVARSHQSTVKLVAYCPSCKKAYGESNEAHLNARFVCPADQGHAAFVVKGDAGKFWLRIELLILDWELRRSPMSWFKDWGGFFRGRAGRYIFLRLFTLICLLWLVTHLGGMVVTSICGFVGFVLFMDILMANTSVVFISRFPAHPLRSAVFTIISFFSAAVSFALFYALSPNSFRPALGARTALYFSTVTIATVGYGDITPRLDSLMQLVVISEILVGLYFLAVLFAVISSWANARSTTGPVPLADVLKTKMEPPD